MTALVHPTARNLKFPWVYDIEMWIEFVRHPLRRKSWKSLMSLQYHNGCYCLKLESSE